MRDRQNEPLGRRPTSDRSLAQANAANGEAVDVSTGMSTVFRVPRVLAHCFSPLGTYSRSQPHHVTITLQL